MGIYQIAIDGPSGSGKSTLAKGIAKELGIMYLDTGAMYRTCAVASIKRGINAKDADAVKKMMDEVKIEVAFIDGVQHMILDGEDESSNTVTVSDSEKPGFKASYLNYRALASKDGLTLVEVKLGTGRSHQIRAQMAHFGHPLIGDQKYGLRDNRTKDIALEAYKLSFEHPVKREFIAFEAPIPSGFPWNLFA